MEYNIKHDKIENNPHYKAQFEAAQKEAEELCIEHKGQDGYCHAIWSNKKRILAEKYGIKWKTPAEMNPRCKFD